MSGVRPFAGVVPSAGSSRRMGRPKALLRVEGETFLSRTIGALVGGGGDGVDKGLGAGAGEQDISRMSSKVR